MFRNYVVIALRNMQRQSRYSFINVFGLALGMACSLVIFLYVYGEWSYDRHFSKGDRIYRIGISFFNMGNFAKGPELLGDFLPDEFEGIEAFTRFDRSREEALQVNDRSFDDQVYFVDSSFFEVFSYRFTQGDAATSMDRPLSVVMTERMAQKYFPAGNAMGRTIEIGKERIPHTVTGIVLDDKRNSHLKASIWASLEIGEARQFFWTSASLYSYALLKENVGEKDLSRALDQLIADRIFPTSGRSMGKKSLEEYVADPNSVKFFIQPLRDIYLNSKLGLELSPGGNETNMIIFGVIAVVILVLAGVNFVNLSTARATRRAKEVGVRKALGTTRSRLIGQFLLESVIISAMALVIALFLAEIFTSAFFWITGQQLSVSAWSSPWTITGILCFSVLVGLVSGLYPAFYLTAFKPAKVLKGGLQAPRAQSFRNSLVVFQFTISITLITCTAIVTKQLNFMSDRDLGFSQDNTVTIDNVYLLKRAALAFKEEVLQHPDVAGASLHTGEPGSRSLIAFNAYQAPGMQEALTVNTYFGDEDYLDVMGFDLVAGRNFRRGMASDSASVILNESAASALGLGDQPVGAVLNNDRNVIGIVRDFHWESLRNPIAPTAIQLSSPRYRDPEYSQLAIRVKSSNAAALLSDLHRRWKQLVPDEPMQYHFLDENFGELLKKEAVLGKAVGLFTVLAIVISCLGLFGLAAYTTEQRTKEIGIRKVLGATGTNIMLMLNRQFTALVFIAILVAVPVSYFVGQEWLSGFAYKTNVDFLIFATGGVVGLVISFSTVAFHSFKASQSSPSEILKCE